MNNGKYSRRKPAKRGYKRTTAILLALALLLTAGVLGTIAYIQTSTPDVANTFTVGSVPPVIHENEPTAENGWKKTEVYVENDGTVPAYIRVAVAATWRDKHGNIAPFSVADGDYTITFPEDNKNWVQGGKYYYYIKPVDSQGNTDVLFKEVTYDPKDGYQLHFQIAASTIQANGTVDGTENGTPVVLHVWGKNANGHVVSVAADGTLSIEQ